MTREEYAELYGEDLLFMDGYDDCIAGICTMFGRPPVVAYNLRKVIRQMIEKDGMTEEEAVEFHEYNQVGAWVGEHTPVFIVTEDEIKEEMG